MRCGKFVDARDACTDRELILFVCGLPMWQSGVGWQVLADFIATRIVWLDWQVFFLALVGKGMHILLWGVLRISGLLATGGRPIYRCVKRNMYILMNDMRSGRVLMRIIWFFIMSAKVLNDLNFEIRIFMFTRPAAHVFNSIKLFDSTGVVNGCCYQSTAMTTNVIDSPQHLRSSFISIFSCWWFHVAIFIGCRFH